MKVVSKDQFDHSQLTNQKTGEAYSLSEFGLKLDFHFFMNMIFFGVFISWLSGWSWRRNTDGVKGWVPTKNLTVLS